MSKHNIDLFEHILNEMLDKYIKNKLWTDKNEINKIEHNELKRLLLINYCGNILKLIH